MVLLTAQVNRWNLGGSGFTALRGTVTTSNVRLAGNIVVSVHAGGRGLFSDLTYELRTHYSTENGDGLPFDQGRESFKLASPGCSQHSREVSASARSALLYVLGISCFRQVQGIMKTSGEARFFFCSQVRSSNPSPHSHSFPKWDRIANHSKKPSVYLVCNGARRAIQAR